MSNILTKEEAIQLIRPKLQEEAETFDRLYQADIHFRDFVDEQLEDYVKDPLVIIASDVSQAEVRMMAQLAGEQKLIDVYNGQYQSLVEGKNIDEMRDVDFHYVTASNIFKKPINEITKEERKKAKTITFALLYGSSEIGIAERTDLSVKDSKELLTRFWESYSGIRTWVGNNLEYAIKHGYIKTPSGRKKFTPTLEGKPEIARNFWKNQPYWKNVPYDRYTMAYATSEARQCQNYPIQSYTSDMVLLGASIVEGQLRTKKAEHYLHTIIHDSIVMSVRFSQVERVAGLIHNVFEKFLPELKGLKMPLLMEAETGFDCFSTVKLPFNLAEVNKEELLKKMLEKHKTAKGKVSFKSIDGDTINEMLTKSPEKPGISKQILAKYDHVEKEFNELYKEYVGKNQLKLEETDKNNILSLMKMD